MTKECATSEAKTAGALRDLQNTSVIVRHGKAPRKRDGIAPWLEYQVRKLSKKEGPGFGVDSSIAFANWADAQRERAFRLKPIDWDRVDRYPVTNGASAFSSTRDPDGQYPLAHLISTGAIISEGVLVKHSCLEYELAAWDRSKISRAHTESEEHVELKLLALGWLRSIGAERAATEVQGRCGRADAYSGDLDIVVECGDSAATRALAVVEGSPAAVLVLPFGRFDEVGYHGVIFRRSNS